MKPTDPSPRFQSSSSESAADSHDAIGPEGPSPLTPYFLRMSDVIGATLLALTFLLMSYRPLWHSDVWAHLKFGQWIVQHRQLPAEEPFSPFTEHQPYVHFQCLSQVGMYLAFAAGQGRAGGDELHRLAGGVEMLNFLFSLLALLRLLLLLLAYRRMSGSMPLACLGLFLVVCVGLFYGNMQRPQVVGEVFFALLLLALSRPVLSRRALVLLPVAFVLWANSHGSYAIGLLLLATVWVGRIITVARAAGSWEPRAIIKDEQVRRLLLAGLTSMAAIAVLNPHGPWLFLYTLQFSQNPNIASMVEWQSLDFQWDVGPHWGYGILCVVVIATQILSPRLLPPTSLPLCATFGVFPLFQRRMLSWWMVLVPWIVLPEWAELGKRISWPWLHYRSEANGVKTLMAVCLLLVALLLTPGVRFLRSGHPRPLDLSLSQGTPWKLAAQLAAEPNASPFYPELADSLKRAYPDSRFRGRIFASETQGDYLLWALPPEYPILIYNHPHLFPPDHWQNCLTVLAGEDGWREILDRYGVNLVVVEAEERTQLADSLRADSDWQIVLDETSLQQKRDPRTRLLIAIRKKPLAS